MFVVAAYEGQGIQIGDRRLTVLSLCSPSVIEVALDGEPESVQLGADRKVELFPQVFVTFRRNLGFSQRIKFLFDAPPQVHIRELPYDPPARDNSLG